MECVSLPTIVVARSIGNGLRLDILSSGLARARIQSLDLVEIVVGARSLRARVIRASLAPRLLSDGAETSPDFDANAALIVADHDADTPIELVGIGGGMVVENPYTGMPVEIRMLRYRLPRSSASADM